MNNGTMIESQARVAILDDIEPEIFAQFTEFAYLGTYRCTPKLFEPSFDTISTDNMVKQLQRRNISKFYCCKCGKSIFDLDAAQYFPTCSSDCRTNSNNRCVLCGMRMAHPSDAVICKLCGGDHELDFSATGAVPCKSWNSFQAREIGALGMSHQKLQDYLKNVVPMDEISYRIVTHAKLFIFADIYDIPSLRALCLHKLHRDLLHFRLQDDSILDLVACIDYIYENTTDEGGHVGEDSDVKSCDLRELVISFAACHAELLKESKNFQDLLYLGGNFVQDYICALVKRLEIDTR